MIEVKQVVKTFDHFRALDGLDINVPSGAIYGLVGPNGAGKSTILRHLTGVLRQDSGEIRIDGAPVFENMDLKRRMASISDDFYFFPQASIRDMMRYYKGIYPGFDTLLYKRLGDVFQLNEKTAMRRLSKGMCKQAAFWLSLCTRPDYLLLDEPVDGLDPVMRRQVWSLVMDEVAQRGITVLISSHNLRELEDVCDHVGIMDHGKMLLERSLDALQDNIVKAQVILDGELPAELDVLHASSSGRIRTLIIRGTQKEVAERLSVLSPVYFETLPLSLEEIFIYELGGVNDAIQNVIL